MEQNKIWKRILWAVDPFSKERKLQASAALAARTLVKNEHSQVERDAKMVHWKLRRKSHALFRCPTLYRKSSLEVSDRF